VAEDEKSAPGLAPHCWADNWANSHGGEPPLSVLLDMLRERIDPKSVSNKQGISFVDVTTIRDEIDARIGGQRYDWDVTKTECISGAPYYVVVGRLTIFGSDRAAVRSGGGAEGLWEHQPYQDGGKGSFKTKAYGDPFTNAEATALRRAAMAFGFCRELWRK